MNSIHSNRLQVRPHAPPNIAVPVPPEDNTFGDPLLIELEGNGTNDRPARDEMVCIHLELPATILVSFGDKKVVFFRSK